MWRPGLSWFRKATKMQNNDKDNELESVVAFSMPNSKDSGEIRPVIIEDFLESKETGSQDLNSTRGCLEVRNHLNYRSFLCVRNKDEDQNVTKTMNVESKEFSFLMDGRSTSTRRAKSLDRYGEIPRIPVSNVNSNLIGEIKNEKPAFHPDSPSRLTSGSIAESPLFQLQENSAIIDLNYIQRLNTQLLVAVEKQNIHRVVGLLAEGANPNATCRLNHVSACHMAALNGGEALPLLLKAGAKTDRFDRLGRTPLYWAAWNGNAKEMAILLKFPEDLQTRCHKDMPPETERKELESLICSKNVMSNIGVINELPRTWIDGIGHACRDIEEYIPISERKWTPLHAASYFARAHCVRLLLESGADTNVEDLNGYIPLENVGYAVHFGHIIHIEEFIETIKLLIKAGSKNVDLNNKGVKTYSPLYTAVEFGNLEAIQLLLEAGVSALSMNQEGWTPMHLCVKKKLKEHMQLIANHDSTHNSSAVNCKDKDGLTVLHAAVKSGWMPGICIALAAGADITIMANTGETALHVAAALNNLDVLNELLEFAKVRGVVDCHNNMGETALFTAVRKGNLECVKKLLNDGASIDLVLPDNTTVLHRAVEKGHVEILSFLIDSLSTVKKYLINSVAKYREFNVTPLHLAVLKNHADCVSLLLSKNADVNLIVTELYTPLQLAAMQNHVVIADIILEFDKSLLNSLSGRKDPLQYACHFNSKDCIKMLLKKGADMTKPVYFNKNSTPLHLIMQNIHKPTDFLEDIFDSCINTHFNDGICIDYSILIQDNKHQMKVVNALRSIGNRHDQKRLLLHPLIESFLNLKWKALLPCFYFIIIIYSLFVTSLTMLVMSMYGYIDKKEDAPVWINTTVWTFTVYGLVILLLHMEIYTTGKTGNYPNNLGQLETWVNYSSILLGFVLALAFMGESDSSCIRYLSTVAVLISWIRMMFLLSRFPNWGYYFLIFGTVASKIMKILLTFMFLLIGFSLGFMIQLKFEKPFDNVWSALIKTVVMMTSEFDYGDLFKEKHSMEVSTIILQVTFLAFIILTAIVLMNLMAGVAVNDVQNLKFIGNINRIEKQIELLVSLELRVNFNQNCNIPPLCRILQKRQRVGTLLTISASDNFTFPSHITDALFEKATNNKKNMENFNDSEAFKNQINEIYNSTVKRKLHGNRV